MTDWDRRYMDVADLLATWSKDPHRQVGCVIVGDAGQILATGYNGMPRGVNDDVPGRYERPEKYFWFEHAERNAIYNAARAGLSLVGARMYATYSPCADCARGIIQSGIWTVVYREDYATLTDSSAAAKVMMEEANVTFRRIDD